MFGDERQDWNRAFHDVEAAGPAEPARWLDEVAALLPGPQR